VIALAAARSQRYVAGGDQLLEAVVDALDVIQHELAADPSWANDLWHRRDGGFEPVSEPEASGWLQRRLREKLSGERGIVFQREVQILQPPGPWPGERTDLHVNAVVQHRDAPAEELTTIIEVKDAGTLTSSACARSPRSAGGRGRPGRPSVRAACRDVASSARSARGRGGDDKRWWPLRPAPGAGSGVLLAERAAAV
jgi:hypothetical protein